MSRGRRRAVVAAIVIGAFVLFASASVGAGSGAWSGRVGVAGHLMWYSDRETEMARLRAGGVDWTREDFLWSTIEPSKGSFDWSWPDTLMTASSRTGMKVLAILDYSTRWSTSGPNGDGAYPPRDNAEFAAYAAAVVRRYGPGGSFWSSHPELAPNPLTAVEVWNEPWGHWAWKPNPDPAAYARLARAAAEAVKAVKPGVEVLISGDLLQVRTDGTIVDWLRNVLAADPGLKNLVDAYSVHPYPYPRERGPFDDHADPRWDFQRVKLIHEVDGSKPLWITEVGWSTAPALDDGISEAQQATFTRDAVHRALAEWGAFVERVFVYSWDRSTGTSGDREGNYGLRRADGSTKPAWGTLAALLGSTPATPLPTPPAAPAGAAAVAAPKPLNARFTIAAFPRRAAVRRGGHVDFTVRLGESSGAGAVALSLQGLPRGGRATVNGVLDSSKAVAVSVRLGRDVRLGTYRLVFRGRAEQSTHTTMTTLVVKNSPVSPSLFRVFRGFFRLHRP